MPTLSNSGARLVGVQQARHQWAKFPVSVRQAITAAAENTAKVIVLRARAKAPMGKPDGAYSGGALRDHIDYTMDRGLGVALVGIRKGAVVAGYRGGGAFNVGLRWHGAALVQKGPRKGQRVRSTSVHNYQAVLSRAARKKLRAGGATIHQPTMYAKLIEKGRKPWGPKECHDGIRRAAGRASANPFIGPAVQQSQDYFLSQMRQGAADVANELKALGYRHA